MDSSCTIVTVIGKGNWERIVLPRTPLLELTTYQQMQINRIRTNSRTSDLVTSVMMAGRGEQFLVLQLQVSC